MGIAQKLHDTFESWSDDWKERVQGWVIGAFTKGIEKSMDSLEPGLRDELVPMLSRMGEIDGIPPEMKKIIDDAIAKPQAIQFAALLPYMIGIMIGLGMGAATPLSKVGSYFIDKMVHSYRHTPGEVSHVWLRDPSKYEPLWQDLRDQGWTDDRIAIAKELAIVRLDGTTIAKAWLRNPVEGEAFWKDVADQGISPERIEILKELAHTRLDPQTVTSIWLRDQEKYAHLWKDLSDQGMTPERIDVLKELALVIPGPSDLVRMAVREVFSPEIVTKYGQMEDFPPDFATWGGKVGLSDEWAKNYWAAHWELPSAGQGYEMLHRNVISKEDLVTLLRTLDVMPYWRDKLIAIAYSPFTRVDVRRMHKLGLLAEDELQQSYQDIGYDPEKALKMVEFTLAYNADPEAGDLTEGDKVKAKERDLTKSDVLNGYEDGLLTLEDARTSLLALGYSDDETEYYISRIDFELERADIDVKLSYYHDAYIRNIHPKITTVANLGKLNLPSGQTDKLMSAWEMEKEVKTNRPTKAELLGFLRRGTITLERCRDELRGHGYTDEHIDWYLSGIE